MMCYLCVARGTVGKGYAATQKGIGRALTVWKSHPGSTNHGWRPKLNRDLTTLPRNRTWGKRGRNV